MKATALFSALDAPIVSKKDDQAHGFDVRRVPEGRGIFDEVQGRALTRALTEQLEESMQVANLTELELAKKMATSRSQLDRVLDPQNVSVQLDTFIKAARAVGTASI